MAHLQYLVFNNENIPMPASYSVNLSDVEADSGGAAGDIVIPVYIGGDMVDEIVVTAQQRMNLRSGGR